MVDLVLVGRNFLDPIILTSGLRPCKDTRRHWVRVIRQH
jgi:hypothetical protein